MEHLGQAPTRRWSLGPLISWTLPGDEEKARVRQADANAAAALARFDTVVLNALHEVESALANLARDLDRDAALRQARDEAAEARRQLPELTLGREGPSRRTHPQGPAVSLADELRKLNAQRRDVRRASAIRHYRITRVRDGALVARIRSLYAWVDLSAGRPVRIPPDFLADFGPNIVA